MGEVNKVRDTEFNRKLNFTKLYFEAGVVFLALCVFTIFMPDLHEMMAVSAAMSVLFIGLGIVSIFKD